MKSLVISIGGSVLFSENIDDDFLKKVAGFFSDLCTKYKIFLVTGGGVLARKYIEIGRKLDLKENTLDELGITATRLNAQLFTTFFKNSNKKIPVTIDEALRLCETYNPIIMGGTTPGHSTDTVAAQLAEKISADKLIIATNVDGVYNKDPNIYPDAKKFDEITIDDLIQISGDSRWDKAGKNMVIDGPACQIIKRVKTPTFIINGKKLINFENLLENKSFVGTKILM